MTERSLCFCIYSVSQLKVWATVNLPTYKKSNKKNKFIIVTILRTGLDTWRVSTPEVKRKVADELLQKRHQTNCIRHYTPFRNQNRIRISTSILGWSGCRGREKSKLISSKMHDESFEVRTFISQSWLLSYPSLVLVSITTFIRMHSQETARFFPEVREVMILKKAREV